ncbi:MAG TPA: L-seryl-tRNA(Sec) selenium transferase [Thermomicrobiales bacterium]
MPMDAHAGSAATARPASPMAEVPSVSSLMREARDREVTTLADEALTRFFQDFLQRVRARIAEGAALPRAEIVEEAMAALAAFERQRLEPVINATGVIIHTNLGRAPVSAEAAAAMAQAAASAVSLEIDPESNVRGGRMSEIASLMRLLTGAEATLVVNNNAAAVLLTLSALAAGRAVIVSRGEAVEIGGGFRIPDVLRQSGAELVEVGTTNRTYARDYAAAIDERTALLLKVHPSNFRISGFTASASVAELAELAAEHSLPVVEDLGSGALIDTAKFGLEHEPTIGESLAAGAAIVTASGDKLLGGPQAGIIAGKREFVARIEAHPLARAVRADKTCLAGLAATLRHYASGEAAEAIPVWRMISAAAERLRERADAIASRLCAASISAEVTETVATIGGGALPGQTLPSFGISLSAPGLSAEEIGRRLRTGAPRVFGYIAGDRYLLDLRTVLPESDDALISAVVAAVK